MKKLLLACLLLAGVETQAATLDFNEFTGASLVSVSSYDSAGFSVTACSLTGIGSAYDGFFATGAVLDNCPGGTITLVRQDSGAFDFNSIDLTRFPGYGDVAPISMLAYDALNNLVDSLSFTIPNVTAFATYAIGFTGVNKVTWAQEYAYHAFDNIVLDASVPEPTTLALVGLGLFGLGVSRRRLRAA